MLERVPVQLGGEEELGLAPGPGTVVRRRLGRVVDGHVRLQTGGRGEYRRAQVTRVRLAAGERVLDQVRLQPAGRGQHARAQAALDAVRGPVERGQVRAQVQRGLLLRLEPDLRKRNPGKGTRLLTGYSECAVEEAGTNTFRIFFFFFLSCDAN